MSQLKVTFSLRVLHVITPLANHAHLCTYVLGNILILAAYYIHGLL